MAERHSHLAECFLCSTQEGLRLIKIIVVWIVWKYSLKRSCDQQIDVLSQNNLCVRSFFFQVMFFKAGVMGKYLSRPNSLHYGTWSINHLFNHFARHFLPRCAQRAVWFWCLPSMTSWESRHGTSLSHTTTSSFLAACWPSMWVK